MNTTNNEPELYAGTPQSATSTSMTLAKDASDIDGAYIMHALRIIEGAGRGEQQTIKSYDGRTKIAALHGTWITVPDATSVYAIINPEPQWSKMLINLNINQDIQTEFESLKEIHGMVFSDALEIGMKIAIKSTQSTDEVRRKINEKKIELQDLYTELYFIKEAQRHPHDDTDFRWDRDGKT
jgi:uncharacterized protein Veg